MTRSQIPLDAFARLLATHLPTYFGELSFTLSCLSQDEDGLLLTLPFVLDGLLCHSSPTVAAIDAFCHSHNQPWRVNYHIPSVQGQPADGVKNILAVASGKGGVGKSTTAVALAFALAKEGAKVGILDADVFGPSVPILLNTRDAQPPILANDKMQPITLPVPAERAPGSALLSMSIGNLVPAENATVWRGPMASRALQQMYNDTHWQTLDYLIVDMPPGTGDIQLTLAQQMPVTAALVVTTPQDLALADAIKGIEMFNKVDTPILGLVENMSFHICSQCGHQEAIFGTQKANMVAQKYGVEVLQKFPLSVALSAMADMGVSAFFAHQDHQNLTQSYAELARQVSWQIAQMPRKAQQINITIQE